MRRKVKSRKVGYLCKESAVVSCGIEEPKVAKFPSMPGALHKRGLIFDTSSYIREFLERVKKLLTCSASSTNHIGAFKLFLGNPLD